MADGKWVMTEDDARRVDLSFSGSANRGLRDLPNYGKRIRVDNRDGRAELICAHCGAADIGAGFGGFGDGFGYKSYKCSKCGGVVKPDVVLYEEALDDACMMGAIRAIQEADTLIIGGTSLVVYPAAGLIRYFSGNNLVLINKQVTPYDSQADLVIHDSIGKVMDLD